MVTSASAPSTWPIIGHEHQVGRLRSMVRHKQFPFAILMTGAPGVGRKALATQMSAAVVCPESRDQIACGTCLTCMRISAGTHPDVEYWSVDRQEQESGKSKSATLTIETVRRIAASTSLRPVEGLRRFIIVDDAETLGDAAQQALLKTLEDLPAFATIILVATSAGSMLDTVRSRSMEIALQLTPTEVIASHLEGPDAATIAALSGGRPGWAITARSNPEWLTGQLDSIKLLESWLRMSRGDRMVEAYVRGDRFVRDRRTAVEDLDRIQMIWRDIVLTETNLPQFAFNVDLATQLARGASAGLPDWRRALVATRQCIQDLTGNIRPRLAMQAMVNQWPTLS
jgi:DNA polymerase III subunit delta'